ncbi:MAG: NAD(P)/FAD-dependent oxidoreductase [Chloroflexi bacterium]|nr:NAD(P)/FAD-dependent oxidoreductase [Chloroflexota bacterium]
MEYGVLGGGALGLTVAYRLAQRGERVTVFEKEREPGGLAAGFKVGDVWLEKFYHHLFRTDKAIIALIEELGLGDRLTWPRPVTATLVNGRVHQLDSPVSLLRFRPLPLPDRIRLGAMLAYLKVEWDVRRLEGKTAAPWIRQWMGKPAYDVLWGPLLKSKFGPLAEEIALPWFWARVHDRTTELGYIRGGFQLLYNRLVERIRELGGEIRLGATVTLVTKQDEWLRVATDVGDFTFDRVVSTLPTRLTCRLAPELPEDYRLKYDWGQAYGAHVLILALRRRLTRSYWLNVNDPGYPFMALVEHTNYMPPADYGDRHLIYLGNYRPMDDPLFTMDKKAVLAELLPHLARLNPRFDQSWVTESWLFRAPFAQPIVTTEYREHIPPFDTPILGLYVANMFQVYPHDRGQNYSVALAQSLVGSIVPPPLR